MEVIITGNHEELYLKSNDTGRGSTFSQQTFTGPKLTTKTALTSLCHFC